MEQLEQGKRHAWIISCAFIQLKPTGDVIGNHRPVGIKRTTSEGGRKGRLEPVKAPTLGASQKPLWGREREREPAEAPCPGGGWFSRGSKEPEAAPDSGTGGKGSKEPEAAPDAGNSGRGNDGTIGRRNEKPEEDPDDSTGSGGNEEPEEDPDTGSSKRGQRAGRDSLHHNRWDRKGHQGGGRGAPSGRCQAETARGAVKRGHKRQGAKPPCKKWSDIHRSAARHPKRDAIDGRDEERGHIPQKDG